MENNTNNTEQSMNQAMDFKITKRSRMSRRRELIENLKVRKAMQKATIIAVVRKRADRIKRLYPYARRLVELTEWMESNVNVLEATSNLARMSETMNALEHQLARVDAETEFMEGSLCTCGGHHDDIDSLMMWRMPEAADGNYRSDVSVGVLQDAARGAVAASSSMETMDEKVDEEDLSRRLAELKA